MNKLNLNILMLTGSFVLIVTFIMMILYHIHGGSVPCSSREHSPLCFCQSTYRHSSLTDLFLSKITLTQCLNSSYSSTRCRQGRLSPSPTHVTQLIPNLVNYSHCLENTQCLHTLYNTQRCQQCQIMSSSLLTDNTSYTISTETNSLPSDSCFYICEHDRSCGFLCFDRRITITVSCSVCRGQRRNVTCRCIKLKKSESCLQSSIETTTARWMQKRGFPAAGILALLVLLTVLLIIVIKLISHQLNRLARREARANRRSITTITTYRSRQASPSTAAISFPSTPLIPSTHIRRDIVTANTMVALLNDKSREYVVDIHKRADSDDLGAFLLKRTTELDPMSAKIADIDDDNEDEDQT